MSFKRALSVAVFSAVVMTGFAANAAEKAAVKADGSAPVVQSQAAPDHTTVKKHHRDTKHHAAVTKDGKGAASVATPAEQKSEVKAPEAKIPATQTPDATTSGVKAEPAPVKAN